MKQYEFESLDSLLECYERDDLIPIDTLKQAIFYISLGVQPELVWPKEDEPQRLTFWFLKKKTQYVYSQWKKSKKNGTKIALRKIED